MNLVETNNNNSDDLVLKSHSKSNIDETTDDNNNNNNNHNEVKNRAKKKIKRKPKNHDVAQMDETDRIPSDFSHINLNSIVKKREKLNKFLKNISSKKNQETEEIIPIEQVLNQTFKEDSKLKKSSSIDRIHSVLNGEKSKQSSAENTIQNLNVSLYQVFERLELVSSGSKLNYRITLKENSTVNLFDEIKIRLYGFNGKTKKFKLSKSDLNGYDFDLRSVGEIIALSLEYSNAELPQPIDKVELIDLKKNLILNFESNGWFNVRLEKNKLASFMFKSASNGDNFFKAQAEHKIETKTEENQREIKDLKTIIKELKPLEKKLKNIFLDKKTLSNLKHIEMLSDDKDLAIDGFLVGFLLSNLEYQLKETKIVKSNVKILLRVLENLITNNSSYITEIGSNEKNLCSISTILSLLLKANYDELEEKLINLIYSIAEQSHLFYNKWIDSNIFQNLLEILETQDTLSYEISNRILQIIKVSYNYNNATDSNVSFAADDESEGVDIFKYVSQLRIDSSLFKSLKFRNAFMYLENLNIRFKDISGANRIILMKFLTILTKTLISSVQNDLGMIDFKKYDIMKTVAYLVQILSIFENFTQSPDFCFEFQKNEYCLKLLFSFLTNDTNLSYIVKECKFQYIVLEHLYTKSINLIVDVFKVSNNVSSINFNDINTIKLFINASAKFNSKLILKSLYIILYQYGYKDAENNYSNYFNLDKLTKCNMINSALTELLSIENVSYALDKRSLLNPILFLYDDEGFYKDVNGESTLIFFLNFLIEDIYKKFIKFSIGFSNFAFSSIDNLDIPKDDYFNEKYIKSIKILLFLYDLLVIITNFSKTSTKFCSSFQKNSQNGILVLLHLLTCSNVEQFILDQNHRSDLFYVLVEEVFDAALSSLLNLSRMSFQYLSVWHETIDPILILYDVAHNFSGVNEAFTLGAYIVITNIISDKEIVNLTVKAKHVIETIVDQIELMVTQLETEPSENVERVEIYLDDDDDKPVDIVTAGSWHLGELIQALVTFSKSDLIKYIVYAEQNMKEILRKIVHFGNEAEKELGFKLLYQLSFDERIAKDIYDDKTLYDFIVNSTKSNNCKCIKWVINSRLNKNVDDIKETSENQENKHVMISYSKESRDFCCKIKNELERLDIKCWIDVDDVNGSSFEVLTTAIEQSSCVLVCMTEKYKEIPDSRLEFEYIVQRKKPFIPLIMQRNYKPDGWLGSLLGTKAYIDTTKYEFDECLNKIAKEIADITNNKTARATGNQSLTSIEAGQDENKTEPFNWKNVEVTKWLNEKNFNTNIVTSVKSFNGELLFYLYKMNSKSLNFFNEKINSESYSPLNLFDLIYFNCELEKLFKNYA